MFLLSSSIVSVRSLKRRKVSAQERAFVPGISKQKYCSSWVFVSLWKCDWVDSWTKKTQPYTASQAMQWKHTLHYIFFCWRPLELVPKPGPPHGPTFGSLGLWPPGPCQAESGAASCQDLRRSPGRREVWLWGVPWGILGLFKHKMCFRICRWNYWWYCVCLFGVIELC